jgi:hypothetical protein
VRDLVPPISLLNIEQTREKAIELNLQNFYLQKQSLGIFIRVFWKNPNPKNYGLYIYIYYIALFFLFFLNSKHNIKNEQQFAQKIRLNQYNNISQIIYVIKSYKFLL